jgi:DNA-binding response OmpR family regulator
MQTHPVDILLIDEDEFLLELLENSIYLHNPLYHTLRATSIKQALEILNSHRIDLVITEVEFSNGPDIAQFLVGLQKRTPPPAVIALTASNVIKERRLRVNTVMSKPPAAELLLSRVDQLIRAARESVLRGVSVESFLQMVAHDGKTCTLTVTAGQRTGRIYLRNGKLIHADAGNVQSKAAAIAILSWKDCTIRICDGCNVVPSITEPLTNILLEACVYRDLLAAEFTGASISQFE